MRPPWRRWRGHPMWRMSRTYARGGFTSRTMTRTPRRHGSARRRNRRATREWPASCDTQLRPECPAYLQTRGSGALVAAETVADTRARDMRFGSVSVDEPPRQVDRGSEGVSGNREIEFGDLESVGPVDEPIEDLGPAYHPDPLGGGCRGGCQGFVDRAGADGAFGRPMLVAGEDDVHAFGQGTEPLGQRVPCLAPHQDGATERHGLEMSEVFGHVPGHHSPGPDDAAVRLGPDEADAGRATPAGGRASGRGCIRAAHTATAARMAGWCW